MAGNAGETGIDEIQSLLQTGQTRVALEQLELYRQNNGDDAQSLFLLGNIQTALDDSEGAIATFQSLIEHYPALPEPYNNLAALYARKGRLKEARETLLTAINLHPSYAAVYENLTKVYATMASIAYSKALERTEVEVTPRGPFAVLENLRRDEPPSAVPEKAAAPATTDMPPEPAPANEPLNKAEETRAISDAVSGWAAAWSKQDVPAYLAYYSPAFLLPDDISREAWEAYRQERLKEPRFIKVSIEKLRVRLLGNGRAASVYFTQAYRSDTYSDAVHKVLVMEKSDGRWQIIQEETVN